jgi:hypothetical protein
MAGPHKLHPHPDWKIGDPVYAACSDRGGPYYVRGIGRIIRFEPPYYLILGIDDLGQFPTREECEAYVRARQKPSAPGKPMAHYTPPSPEPGWQCLRCEQERLELPPTVPEHSPRCPKRDVAVKS